MSETLGHMMGTTVDTTVLRTTLKDMKTIGQMVDTAVLRIALDSVKARFAVPVTSSNVSHMVETTRSL